MCTHAQPTVNNDGPGGYGLAFRAPALLPDDALLFDLPGRCRPQVNGKGSTDYHSHHLRLVARGSMFVLLVRHGGGEEAHELGYGHTRIRELVALLPDDDARYLMLYALYRASGESAARARAAEADLWRGAAARDRIRTRKMRGRDEVKVWIEREDGVHVR